MGIKNLFLIAFTAMNFLSLMLMFCLADSITSWQPFAIMGFNFAWLCLMAYANGWTAGKEITQDEY